MLLMPKRRFGRIGSDFDARLGFFGMRAGARFALLCFGDVLFITTSGFGISDCGLSLPQMQLANDADSVVVHEFQPVVFVVCIFDYVEEAVL